MCVCVRAHAGDLLMLSDYIFSALQIKWTLSKIHPFFTRGFIIMLPFEEKSITVELKLIVFSK